MNIIDPKTIMVAIPAHDGRIMAETAGALVASRHRYGAISFSCECSHVSLVRNIVAEKFLSGPFDWLVCIDSDISFQEYDLALLLEPALAGAPNPQPTRELIPLIVGRNDGAPVHAAGAADVLVCAEYSYKNDALEAVKFGLGFTRIHRSVFSRLRELKHEDGMPRLWSTQFRGKMIHDFYPSGPLINNLVPTAEWKGEDHGFFTLCMLAGIIPRVETRTRLVHIGRKGYEYNPGFGGAQ